MFEQAEDLSIGEIESYRTFLYALHDDSVIPTTPRAPEEVSTKQLLAYRRYVGLVHRPRSTSCSHFSLENLDGWINPVAFQAYMDSTHGTVVPHNQPDPTAELDSSGVRSRASSLVSMARSRASSRVSFVSSRPGSPDASNMCSFAPSPAPSSSPVENPTTLPVHQVIPVYVGNRKSSRRTVLAVLLLVTNLPNLRTAALWIWICSTANSCAALGPNQKYFGLVILDEHPVPRERTLNFFRRPTNPVNTVPPLAFSVTYPRIPNVPPADLGFTVHPRANSVLSAWDSWPNRDGSFSCDLTVQNVLDTAHGGGTKAKIRPRIGEKHCSVVIAPDSRAMVLWAQLNNLCVCEAKLVHQECERIRSYQHGAHVSNSRDHAHNLFTHTLTRRASKQPFDLEPFISRQPVALVSHTSNSPHILEQDTSSHWLLCTDRNHTTPPAIVVTDSGSVDNGTMPAAKSNHDSAESDDSDTEPPVPTKSVHFYVDGDEDEYEDDLSPETLAEIQADPDADVDGER
ncbi:hypothetical protein GGX14DRAFT_389717 [Mycena pura]|uniref:Uncharacterized protein n=1 Tax=Mycena pura TaxID=153505 RepID=A0AAD6VU38_9AGAR|nr:hypothetical protein GGX14DRAFT_389717 [Mycena pura]